jgi:hypothetical protein
MNDNNKNPFDGNLCQPLDPDAAYGVVCTKQFPREGITLSLRPLSLSADDTLLKEFAILELPERKELAEVLYRTKKEELGLLTISDLGQSFIGFIDDQPAFLVSIYRMQQNNLGRYYSSLPGDYRIHLERLSLVGGRDGETFALAIWQACPAWFFSFPEVKRLITALDIERPSEKQYCRAVGFRPLARTGGGPDWEELYVHSGQELKVDG